MTRDSCASIFMRCGDLGLALTVWNMGVGCAAAGHETESQECQGAKGNARVCATTVGRLQLTYMTEGDSP